MIHDLAKVKGKVIEPGQIKNNTLQSPSPVRRALLADRMW